MAPTTMTVPDKGNGSKTVLAPAQTGPLATLKRFCADPETQRRLKEMLGNRAGAFTNSIINVVKNSKQLQEIAASNPASIMSSAMAAASVNLPIEPALGFAAIVPYMGKNPAAQFQLMYKGLIQLAQRTGKYATMNEAVVYKDELEFYNPITGELKFTPQAGWKLRYAADQKLEDVAGFYFRFELTSGFQMERFLSYEEAMAHGRRFSKSYQADLRNRTATSLWSTMPLVMGIKTLIKMTLSKYGILSIEMQDALVAENDDFSGDAQHVESCIVEDSTVGGVEGLKARMMQGEVPAEAPAAPVAEEKAPEGSPDPAAQSPTALADVDDDLRFQCDECLTRFKVKPASHDHDGKRCLGTVKEIT